MELNYEKPALISMSNVSEDRTAPYNRVLQRGPCKGGGYASNCVTGYDATAPP